MSKNNTTSVSGSATFSESMMLFSTQNSPYAVLADEMGLDKVSLFSTINATRAATVPTGTKVMVLGPAGLSGYVVVMTATKEVFEVWHENLRYCVNTSRNFKSN
jgi:hypothetical protein